MGRILSSLIFLIILVPAATHAQVIITEIMYDLAEGSDSGREWVEVHNTGSDPVDLTEWKLFEGDTNHGLKPLGETMLAPGGYAIIADNPTKFAADWPSFSGLLFDSAFSLNNTGETLVMRCCGKDLSDRDSVTYNATGGGAGDGLSLHRSGSSIVVALPSPGSGAIEQPVPIAEEESEPEPEPVMQQKVEEQKPNEEEKVVPQQAEEQKVSIVSETPKPSIVVQEEKEPEPRQEVVADALGDEEETSSEDMHEAGSQVAAAKVASAPTSSESSWLWWGGAGALSIIGAAGAYAMGRARKREWDIEEID